jgi:murein DD-endopeptidase MepM/ murein hydrolase activator NlpD
LSSFFSCKRGRMKRIALIAISIVLVTLRLSAAEQIQIDSAEIQELKGKAGKWVQVNQRTTLQYIMKEYACTREDIYALNEIAGKRSLTGNYVFVPFSAELLESLASRGVARTVVETSDDEFLWPIERVNNISSILGLRGGKFHTGMDIPAERGTPVRASMEGRVVFSGYLSGFGNSLEIEHRNNFITRYCHNAVNFVKKGDFVRKGQYIGCVGSTGNSTGNHLHYEIRCVDVPLDPLDFLPGKSGLLMPHSLKNWK